MALTRELIGFPRHAPPESGGVVPCSVRGLVGAVVQLARGVMVLVSVLPIPLPIDGGGMRA